MKFLKYISLLFAITILSGCVNRTPNTVVFISSNNPPHVLYAARYVGMQERQDRQELQELMGVDPVRTEWCAAFLNAVLENRGIAGSDSVSEYPLMARSFLDWGESVDTPRRGDIVVFRRGNSNWEGHVAIYLGTVERNGRVYYRILGGNQNNEVNVSDYPANLLIDIRRMNNPLQRGQGVILALR